MENSTNLNKKQQQQQLGGQFYSLPEEILTEILVRIPANQLIRFKAVCKSWRSLISHPSFQHSHLLDRSRRSDLQMIMLTSFWNSNYQFGPPHFHHCSKFLVANQPSGYYDPDTRIISVVNAHHGINQMRVAINRINFPGLVFSVKASCNGLLLLRDQYKLLFLYNPVTATYKHLPGLVHRGDVCVRGNFDFNRIYDWTLFYDACAGKYKVCGLRYHGVVLCHFILHTVGEDSWSELFYMYYLKPISPLIYLNGKLHWLTFDSRFPYEIHIEDPGFHQQCFILSMDLAEITFTRTMAPVEQNGKRHLLTEVNGSLCLTSFSGDQLDIFVLEDFASGLWTKQYSISLPSLSNLPVSLRSFLSEDVCVVVVTRELNSSCDFSGLVKIFIHDEDELICYDLKHQEWSIMGPLKKEQRLRESYQFYSPTFVRV